MNTDLFDELTTESSNQPPFKLPNGQGYTSTWDECIGAFTITIPNGTLIYYESFFNKKISDRTVEYFLENESKEIISEHATGLSPDEILWRNISWRQDEINMFGKVKPLPRLSSWHGNSDKPYTYSGLTLQPKEWNKGLLYIKDKIEEAAGIKFNSVLMNWYRDGNDHISWHTDAEKELGINPIIGSANFGETRRFLLRRSDNKNEKIEIPLKHGTVLIMKGETQHFWQHSVPKEKKIKGSRFNLTFRSINS
jgi:alkylated DNA repair dioxygenase AlkB